MGEKDPGEVVGHVASPLTFLNSFGYWWFVSSVFLTSTSCSKITHSNDYCGGWPGGRFLKACFPRQKCFVNSSLLYKFKVLFIVITVRLLLLQKICTDFVQDIGGADNSLYLANKAYSCCSNDIR